MSVITQTHENDSVIPNWFAQDIANELMNNKFINRTHGTKSGLNAGCNGPLCSKFNRDRSRAIYDRDNPTQVRDRPGPEDPERDRFLDTLIVAHVESRRAKRQVSMSTSATENNR